MSSLDLRAEAERRTANLAAGRAPTDDGVTGIIPECDRNISRPNPPLVVPWALVAADNHRMMPARIGQRARLITAPKYRKAKEQATENMARQWTGAPLDGEVTLDATAWFPDARKRDAGNYRKLLTDALSGIAYGDDAQLVVETWRRGGIDRDNPRIELTVRAHIAHQGDR